MSSYGQELILDLHDCDPETFTRKSILNYFIKLCDGIGMERSKLVWWDDVGVAEEDKQTEPHLKGTSAVQFITTSNIVIHTLDLLGNVYLNIFSCKNFDNVLAEEISAAWFKGRIARSTSIERV